MPRASKEVDVATNTKTARTIGEVPNAGEPAGPCIMVIFGASGDLTKRLLMPALYNLECDGLLPEKFAVVGYARKELTSESFRDQMSKDIRQFSTRKTFEEEPWNRLATKLHYTRGGYDDVADYERLAETLRKLDQEIGAGGNVLFYMAVPPESFGRISTGLEKAGFTKADASWRRIIVEKPFGTDLQSALALNREILTYWSEDQVYRIDHYLGKETVQNLLAFRFSNGIFEPLWNKNHIDHVQFTVSEMVGVEGRGAYYEKSGVLRDMIQNHMFQMLAYLCMEPPTSFKANAIRDEKFKVLDSIRILSANDVRSDTVRGQYGAGKKPDGTPGPAYRDEPGVAKDSRTETFAAMKLHIDNWRWEGVPIYLRSGKGLVKRGTEIAVQFKKAPEVIFRNTPTVSSLNPNLLLFHIQPDQAVELRFHAKVPGPKLSLQTVNMRFDYSDSFEASRGTGYEVMLYSCMLGDATLFSRTDLVEAAWRVAQPMIDVWSATPGDEFPNYPRGTWGPKAAYDLIERDGRKWVEVVNRDVLKKVPLFSTCDDVFLHSLALSLKPDVVAPGDEIVKKGDDGNEMFIIVRGEVEVVDGTKRKGTLHDGDFFGETSLLLAEKRNATVRALTNCDLFVLERGEFNRVLREHPELAESLMKAAKDRRGAPAS